LLNHCYILFNKMKKFEKYLTRKNASMPQEHLEILKNGKEIPSSSVLQRSDVNELLEEGYLKEESGYFRNDDGSTYVAVFHPG